MRHLATDEGSGPDALRWVPGVAIWRRAGPVAAATPDRRDRVVDLLRAASLMVVVLGHVLMGVVTWHGGRPQVGNLLAELPDLQLATWALQVMPVFFAVGAVANRASYASAVRRGTPWRVWVWHRLRRVERPVIVYLAIWIPLALVLAEAAPRETARVQSLCVQLLWFIGVYAVVVATTPWLVRLAVHGLPGALALLAPIALADLGRFHIGVAVGVVNFLLVWCFAATLGLVVRDRVGRAPRDLVALVLGALVVNVVLVSVFPYPLSLVGLPGDDISNAAPPTLVLALHAVALVGLVGLAWPALTRWCARPVAWHAVVAVGGVALTVYLWHLTALIAVTYAEHELGWSRGAVGSSGFWLGTVVHVALVLAVTLVLVSIFGRFEYTPIPWLERPPGAAPGGPGWSVLAAFGIVAVGIGFLVLAGTGLRGFPFAHEVTRAGVPLTPGLGFGLVVAGTLAVRAGGRRPGSVRIATPARGS